jgi:hypothetical protein
MQAFQARGKDLQRIPATGLMHVALDDTEFNWKTVPVGDATQARGASRICQDRRFSLTRKPSTIPIGTIFSEKTSLLLYFEPL